MGRVVVIGAGVVGASCAWFAVQAGWDVTLVDPLPPGGGTTSRGEGNLLVSDKGAGPELALMQASRLLWLEVAQSLGRDSFELDEKGGLVVATTGPELEALTHFAEGQRRAGVVAHPVAGDDLWRLEPHLARDLPGAVLYPEDLQVQPVLAAAGLARAVRRAGGVVRLGDEVVAAERDAADRLRGVRLSSGEVVRADVVVNAAGTWGGVVGARLGAPIPIHPRRGFVLVTAPVGQLVRHKVYTAAYVADVASDDAALQTSTVVEGTRSGTVLIGASRERVGFDRAMSPRVVHRLAAGAVRILPVLAGVDLLRTYRGFRPYSPDHLPIIGPDPRVHGVIHACGHEGAGVGLAAATGFLVARHLDGAPVPDGLPVTPFLPDRLLRGGPLRVPAEAS
ncbi:FAD-dependent oxidoreductase [Dermatophilaceae bacterium Soc4.6]